MKTTRLNGLVAMWAAVLVLSACVSPIDSENASVALTTDRSIALSGGALSLNVSVDLSERHAQTAYQIVVYGKSGTGDWSQLDTAEKEGDFSGRMEVVFPAAGTWQTELRLVEPDSVDVLVSVAGPVIEVYDERSLNIAPIRLFDTWITGEPMPLAPSITPEKLADEFSWAVEILRGAQWEEVAVLDPQNPQLPPFTEEEEALQSLRFVGYVGNERLATSETFELRVASPGTLIREAWNRENSMRTPEELWDELSSSTYPGVQNPSDADRAYVLRVYRNQGMPRTSVLLETLVKVPDIDLAAEYNYRACSDPEVLAAGIEGTHFLYDIVWYRDRISSYSTFFEGQMYQHRSLCYD